MSTPPRPQSNSKDFTSAEFAAAREVPNNINEEFPTMQKYSRVLHCVVTGSLNVFEMMGGDIATWKIVEGKAPETFTESPNHDGFSDSITKSADLAAATQSLRNANITKATLLQCHNTFPIPLGVTINCLPRTEVVETGEKFTFTTMPNCAVNMPHTLFEAGDSQSEANAWKKAFPTFNSKNLETQGVLHLNNCPYVFVNEKHPVINLCRMNKSVIGVDIDTLPKMDNEWYKLARPLMATCCDIIRTKILSKMRMPEDLSQICLQLHRLNGEDWAHVDKADILKTFAPNPSWDAQTLQVQMKAHENNFSEKVCTFMGRINLEYELPKCA